MSNPFANWKLSDVDAHNQRVKPDVALVDRPGEPRESDLHEKIFNECRRRGWIAFHGSMSERTHRTLGEPDFIILMPAGNILFVECKSATGKLRPEQAALHAWVQKLGHMVYVVRSFQEFLNLL